MVWTKSKYPISKNPNVLLLDEAGNKLIMDSDGKLAVTNAEGKIVNRKGIKKFVRNAQSQGFDINFKARGKKDFLFGEEIHRRQRNTWDMFPKHELDFSGRSLIHDKKGRWFD